jgi:hypothetical protein
MKQYCQIDSYFHCRRCTNENRRSRIAVGVNAAGTHLKVWCENHDIQLGPLFELKDAMPMACEMCGKIGPHVH